MFAMRIAKTIGFAEINRQPQVKYEESLARIEHGISQPLGKPIYRHIQLPRYGPVRLVGFYIHL
jgi:hypothetical protein